MWIQTGFSSVYIKDDWIKNIKIISFQPPCTGRNKNYQVILHESNKKRDTSIQFSNEEFYNEFKIYFETRII